MSAYRLRRSQKCRSPPPRPNDVVCGKGTGVICRKVLTERRFRANKEVLLLRRFHANKRCVFLACNGDAVLSRHHVPTICVYAVSVFLLLLRMLELLAIASHGKGWKKNVG